MTWFRIKLKNGTKIVVEKKSAINDDSEAIDESSLLRDASMGEENQPIRDPKRLTKSLDEDEDYESRKGVASFFQKIFRGARKGEK